MASIHAQPPRKDGSIPYKVSYRVDGKQHTKTFNTKAAANKFIRTIDTMPAAAVDRRLEVTAVQVSEWETTSTGGSASIHITWNWVAGT